MAVHNNSFVVRPGEVFGLLGPNGAGKSTTLNMIIAEEGPTKGTVSCWTLAFCYFLQCATLAHGQLEILLPSIAKRTLI